MDTVKSGVQFDGPHRSFEHLTLPIVVLNRVLVVPLAGVSTLIYHAVRGGRQEKKGVST